MKLIIVMALVALGLSGCATIPRQTGYTGPRPPDAVCKNELPARLALNTAYTKIESSVADPVKREAALSPIRVALAYLDRCITGQ